MATYSVFKDDKPKGSFPFKDETTLAQVREILEKDNIMKTNDHFVNKQKETILTYYEEELKISEIARDSSINIQSLVERSLYTIIKGDQSKKVSVLADSTLKNLREQSQGFVTSEVKFMGDDNAALDQEQEEHVKVSDLATDNKIKIQNPDEEQTFRITKGEQNIKALKLKCSVTLKEVRDILQQSNDMKTDDVFVDDNYDIPHEEESKKKITDIVSEGNVLRINIKKTWTEKLKDQLKKGEPLEVRKAPEGIEHDYKSPEKTLTEEEDVKQKVAALDAVVHQAEIKDPTDLEPEDWTWLINRNQLLSGIDVNRDIPRRAFKNAFISNANKPTFIGWDASEIEVTLTYSARSHSYVLSKFQKNEASASFPFASASFSHSKKERDASLAETRTVYIVAAWNYPRAILKLDASTIKINDQFKRDIEAALDLDNVTDIKKVAAKSGKKLKQGIEDLPDPNDGDDKPSVQRDYKKIYRALTEVFNEYGHVYPTEVMLGGQLYLTDKKEVSTTKTEKQVETEISASVSAKIGSFSAGYGHASGKGEKTTDESVDQYQDVKLTATGGNTLLANFKDPSYWIATVGDFKNWRVIKLDKVVPIYKLLEKDLQKRIDEVIAKVNPTVFPYSKPVSLEVDKEITPKDRYNLDGLVVATIINDLSQTGKYFQSYVVGNTAQNKNDLSEGIGKKAIASMLYKTEPEPHISHASLMLPVRKTEYLAIKLNSTNRWRWAENNIVVPEKSVYFFPFIGAVFDQWEKEEINISKWFNFPGGNVIENPFPSDNDRSRALRDGFLLCSIKCSDQTDMSRGSIAVNIWNPELDAPVYVDTLKAYSSVYKGWKNQTTYIPCQSFCVPIKKDEVIYVQLEINGYDKSEAELIADARLVYICENTISFGPREKREVGILHLADTDGILVARMQADKNRSQGFIEIFTSENEKDLESEEALGSTSVYHQFNDPIFWKLPYNTITVPIRVGNFFKVKFTNPDKSFSDAQVFLEWIPIIPSTGFLV